MQCKTPRHVQCTVHSAVATCSTTPTICLSCHATMLIGFIAMSLPQAAEFSGRCTLDQEADADIKRAGYCVASSKVEYIADYFDLSGFSHLVYSVKGDGRTYIANVRVDSMAGTGGDVWQAPFRPR